MAKLPFVAGLRTAFPDTDIVWITAGDTSYRTLLRPLTTGVIDRFVQIPEAPAGVTPVLFPRKLLVDQPPDLVIDTQTRFRTSLWLRRALPHRRFFCSAFSGLFSGRLSPLRSSRSSRILDRLLALGALAAGAPLSPPPLVIPQKSIDQAGALLPPGRDYIGYAVGSADPKKRWPLDRFVELIGVRSAMGDVPVIFLGPDELNLYEPLRAVLPDARFPLQTSAAGDPFLTIALARHLRAAVANDSGGAHLLAAGGAPMIWIFDRAEVRDRYAPASITLIALAPEDFGGRDMTDVGLENVNAALDSLLRPLRAC